MENNYKVRAEHVEAWKKRLTPERYEQLEQKGIDIEDVVAFAREWDMALQRVLNQLEVKS